MFSNKKSFSNHHRWCEKTIDSDCLKGHKSHNAKGINAGAKNYNWKGEDVGYAALHIWVRAKLPKPDFCQHCHEKPPLDLANKGTYDRNLENWEWLCRSCHMTKDGRMKNLVNQSSMPLLQTAF